MLERSASRWLDVGTRASTAFVIVLGALVASGCGGSGGTDDGLGAPEDSGPAGDATVATDAASSSGGGSFVVDGGSGSGKDGSSTRLDAADDVDRATPDAHDSGPEVPDSTMGPESDAAVDQDAAEAHDATTGDVVTEPLIDAESDAHDATTGSPVDGASVAVQDGALDVRSDAGLDATTEPLLDGGSDANLNAAPSPGDAASDVGTETEDASDLSEAGLACTSQTTQCSGNDVQTCSGTGTWVTTSTCPYVCSGGACTGVCVPDAIGCASSTQTETCGSNGQWGNPSTCPSVQNATATCSNGICGFSCDAGYTNCNGSCVDLASDSNNCGSCGRPCCGGGACSNDVCQQTAIPNPAGTGPVAVDNTNLYWESSPSIIDDARFMTASPAAALVQNDFPVNGNDGGALVGGTADLVSNGATLFWTAPGQANSDDTGVDYSGVYSIPITGGTITSYFYGGVGIAGAGAGRIAVDAQNVFWGNSVDGSTAIWWHAISGNSTGTAYQPPDGSYILDFASDGTYLYATLNQGLSPVWKVPVHGGTPTVFLSVPSDAGHSTYQYLTTDGVNLYVWYSGTPALNFSDSGLWAEPLSGAPPTQLVATEVYVGDISTDGTSVFYVTASGGGSAPYTLSKVSVNGGAPTVLLNLGDSTGSGDYPPPVNGTCVYAPAYTSWVTINKNP
jgi:hypothetical protein